MLHKLKKNAPQIKKQHARQLHYKSRPGSPNKTAPVSRLVFNQEALVKKENYKARGHVINWTFLLATNLFHATKNES